MIECLSVERLAPFGLVVTVDSHSLRGEGSLPTGFSRDLLGLFPDLLGFILIIFFAGWRGGRGEGIFSIEERIFMGDLFQFSCNCLKDFFCD